MGKYLVTGGCGFIGSHLVESLLKNGHQVCVIDDLSSGRKENISNDVEFLHGSITDKNLLAQGLHGVDGCFHLAAIASVEKSTQDWSKTHEINQTGIIYLFEEIRKLPRPIFVIYASSASVYGNCSHFPLKESELVFPVSPYGVDKLACELQAYVAKKLFDISSVGLRFFNVYGPRQELSPYSGVISIFAKAMMQDEPILIYGNGSQQRDFIYVQDVIACILKIMEAPINDATIYNLCTGKSYSVLQIAQQLEEIFDKKVEIIFKEARAGDPILSIGDPEKLEKAYQFRAKTSLKEGLTALIHAHPYSI